MPPEGMTTFNFQQLPPQQQLQIQDQQGRQALPSTTSASSTTGASTPGSHIYDISSINNTYDCEGDQPPSIGRHRHIFEINQLNREHLWDLPRGLLRRSGILCDTGAVTSVVPRNFADHAPLQPHYTQLALSTPTNQPTHIYGYKDILLVCNNISFPVRFYICDMKAPLLGLHDIFDSEIILHINGKDCSAIEHHGETEPPFRSPCWVCKQAKGRGGKYRWQHEEENVSIIQLDYTFTHDPHQAPQRSGRPHYQSVCSCRCTERNFHAKLTSIECKMGLFLYL